MDDGEQVAIQNGVIEGMTEVPKNVKMPTMIFRQKRRQRASKFAAHQHV